LPEATNLDKTSLGSDLDLDTPTYEKPQHVALGTPARPMIFQKDGSVKRQQSAFPDGATDNGKSLDVNILLQTTDWSKTGLGPMESWPQSLKSAGESHKADVEYELISSVPCYAVPTSVLSLVGQRSDLDLQCAVLLCMSISSTPN